MKYLILITIYIHIYFHGRDDMYFNKYSVNALIYYLIFAFQNKFYIILFAMYINECPLM